MRKPNPRKQSFFPSSRDGQDCRPPVVRAPILGYLDLEILSVNACPPRILSLDGCLPSMKLSKEKDNETCNIWRNWQDGKIVVDQAVAEGHEINFLARDLAKLSCQQKRVKILSGDVSNLESIPELVRRVLFD